MDADHDVGMKQKSWISLLY